MKKALFLLFLLVLVCSPKTGNAQTECYELKTFFMKVESLENNLSPNTSKISPDIGRMREEYEDTLNKIDFLKTSVLRDVDQSLRNKDFSKIDSYIEFINSLSDDDPVRLQFLPLSKALRSKIIFRSVTTKELAEADLQERISFLENNEGGFTRPPSTPRNGNKKRNQVPIYIAFHWHMHQPIYWPYDDIITTQNKNVYSFSLYDVFTSRSGPYTSWPHNSVKSMADSELSHGGAQVSFSGSLIENLNHLAKVNGGFTNWSQFYRAARNMKTTLGNPRLDLVAFGYHHPLMALIGYEDIRRQIDAHREIVLDTFGDNISYSKGIFPPENAFAEWMIPALVDSKLDWVMVDNIHFNRACQGYPWVKGENLFPPNPADQVNPNPGNWVQLNGLWAPSKVSAWADRPHWVEYIDPKTGETAITPEGKKARMIAVPTERYLGNEDGRGGFGALNYDMVMSQLLPFNTDPKHPVLLVLHHDGDNYGGGTDSYYHANFRRFVDWVKANRDRFAVTTIQDYLDEFPPAKEDVIHVEPGSWAGADNGDPEFLKWNGNPNPQTRYSPDRNSWGVMTACRNIVQTAKDQNLPERVVKRAEEFLMVSQTSCYEYWDGTEMWDSHPTRGCNEANDILLPLLSGEVKDRTPPAIYIPQRRPYNPGGMEWGSTPEPSDFTVWSYAYDFGGLDSVTLHIRSHPGKKAPDRTCKRLKGGAWQDFPMQGVSIAAQTNPKPRLKAREFSAEVKGKKSCLIDYYVSATDKSGNQVMSPILHVYVGDGSSQGGGNPGMTYSPKEPKLEDTVTFTLQKPGKLHWGINTWTLPPSALWPQDTILWPDNKAVETPCKKTAAGKFQAVLGPFSGTNKPVEQVDVVPHFDDGSWGKDVKIRLK